MIRIKVIPKHKAEKMIAKTMEDFLNWYIKESMSMTIELEELKKLRSTRIRSLKKKKMREKARKKR